MFKQTLELIQSLPNFAKVLKAADKINSSDWEIVRWQNVLPSEVYSEHIYVLADADLKGKAARNRFASRTGALRLSEHLTRPFKDSRTEEGHWGVWRWTEAGVTCYQTVLPINRGLKNAQTGSSLSMPTGQNATVRVSEQAYAQVRRWAEEDGMTLQAALETALREYDRQRFFAKADAAYKVLRSDAKAWAEEAREREEFDGSLLDDQEAPEETGKKERKSA